MRSQVSQAITTEETAKILEANRKKTQALICQYNRPFSIGRLKVELLPSGSVLGGASLHVETPRGRVLYAPSLQSSRIPTVHQMQLKRAHTLILGASHPDPKETLPNRKRERERLVEYLKKCIAEKVYPSIFCLPIGTAQELTKLLTENGLSVAVHSTIYRINRIYEAYGSSLGEYSHFRPGHSRGRIGIFPLPDFRSTAIRGALADNPVIYVEESLTPSPDPAPFRSVDERFVLSTTCDGKEMREVIGAVDPKEVFVFGPYAKRYAEEFADMEKCRVRPLYSDDQPTLL